MPLDIQFKTSNYEKLRAAVLAINDGERYRGYMKDTITRALADLRDYVREITHRETGTLAESHQWEYDSHLMKGRLYIAPWMLKLHGHRVQWPYVYGPYEHARGGTHAFYERAMSEKAPFTVIREMNANIRMFEW